MTGLPGPTFRYPAAKSLSDHPSSHEAGDAGLTKFARLDTTVTVM